MPSLNASDLIALWERARPASPIERADAILAAAWPELGVEGAARLPVGARDRLLMTLRAALFGPVLEGRATCPGCRGSIELAFDFPAALAHPAAAPALTLALGGRSLDARLPTARDIAALAGAGLEGKAAARRLVERCVEGADFEPFSDHEVARLGDALAAADPLSELLLAADCPLCGRSAALLLDPLAVLWADIEARVLALMSQVARLAEAFGWREADILQMSELRRGTYLSMAPA